MQFKYEASPHFLVVLAGFLSRVTLDLVSGVVLRGVISGKTCECVHFPYQLPHLSPLALSPSVYMPL